MTPQEIKVTLPLFHLKNQCKNSLRIHSSRTYLPVHTYRGSKLLSNLSFQAFFLSKNKFFVCDEYSSHTFSKTPICDEYSSPVMTTLPISYLEVKR